MFVKKTFLARGVRPKKKEGKVTEMHCTYQDPRTTTSGLRKRHKGHLPTVNVLYAFFETTMVGRILSYVQHPSIIGFRFARVWPPHHVSTTGHSRDANRRPGPGIALGCPFDHAPVRYILR